MSTASFWRARFCHLGGQHTRKTIEELDTYILPTHYYQIRVSKKKKWEKKKSLPTPTSLMDLLFIIYAASKQSFGKNSPHFLLTGSS